MSKDNPKFLDIDDYISQFPLEVQEILEKIRSIVKEVAPEATEGISYGIPTFYLNGKYFIYFAAWKKHISIYPIPNGSDEFNKEIEKYAFAKGTLKFPLNKPIPYDLIKRIVEVKLQEEKGY